MDVHFRVLGIPRGCNEADMKKAYRQKALDLHPDRNPNGADEFKKVNAAYEALQQHFRRNGGRDVHSGLYSAARGCDNRQPPAGSGFRHARQAHEDEEIPRQFTEEELFGKSPGGFTQERRNFRWKGYARYGAKPKAGDTGSNDGSAGIPNCARPPDRGQSKDVDERWRRAHGARVPVSGYSHVRSGGAPSPMHGNAHSEQREGRQRAESHDATRRSSREPNVFNPPRTTSSETNERPFAFKFGSASGCKENGHSCASDGRAPHREDIRNRAQTTNPSTSDNLFNGSTEGRCNQGDNGKSKGTDVSTDTVSSSGSTSPITSSIIREFESPPTMEEVLNSWEAFNSNLSPGGPKPPPRAHDGSRGEGANGTTCKEDFAFRAAQFAGADSDTSLRSTERRRLDEEYMGGILEEKLQLKRVLFTKRYMPDPADVALMSDSDVYVVCELLRDVCGRMDKVLASRMLKGLCSRCNSLPKQQHCFIFTCSHTSVCTTCAAVCRFCPVCAAPHR
ncbi:putative chaperone protein DNAj [Trypanosoma vivax]|uniref:Putative chaperone protein DNAj n=1 Tax=Trypanosoma vivax (strain Y486) TaxID=1055687 RepID=G0TRH8_TRYVY|nr:putative chaperone protein DNAj [Trypanosoma vivax]KAH8603943.1 putative chaperone protein DNAj [Trypanosoma vivax]CCC46542.1 putative chaperone protein DNAj [Trypanosoma vivax Y486]